MGYLNKVMVIGNLGRKPELYNNDPNKKAFLTGSIAVDDSYTNRQTGEKVKRTTWVEFVMNGARAEAFFKYADKGGTFYLEGELYDDTYNSKPAPMPVYDANMQPVMNAQGQQVYYNIVVERTTKKLRCRDWKFMDGKRQDNAYTGPAVAGAPVQAQAAPAQAPTYAPVAPPMAAPVAPVAPATPAAVAATFSAPAGTMAVPPQFAMPVNNMPPGV